MQIFDSLTQIKSLWEPASHFQNFTTPHGCCGLRITSHVVLLSTWHRKGVLNQPLKPEWSPGQLKLTNRTREVPHSAVCCNEKQVWLYRQGDTIAYQCCLNTSFMYPLWRKVQPYLIAGTFSPPDWKSYLQSQVTMHRWYKVCTLQVLSQNEPLILVWLYHVTSAVQTELSLDEKLTESNARLWLTCSSKHTFSNLDYLVCISMVIRRLLSSKHSPHFSVITCYSYLDILSSSQTVESVTWAVRADWNG